MVQLLHHYETQTNRLLEHVQGGHLVDHIHTLRQLHKQEAAPASGEPHEKKGKEKEERMREADALQQCGNEDSLTRKLEALEVVRSVVTLMMMTWKWSVC